MTGYPAYDLEAVRRAFPIAQQLTYLNHASISPIPTPTRQVMVEATDRLASDPFTLFVPTPDDPLSGVFDRFSDEIARLIHAAHPREVVGVVSTSAGINLVAQSINWQPGDNIIFCDVEFPSNAYPWMVLERRGIETRLACADSGGLTLEAVDPLVDGKTRLVAVSAVQFLSGHRADLAALGAYCRARGILFAVDAIQAAGHMPIDVQAMQIDILVAGGQKSLMGPPGQGFLYVRDEAAATMQPGMIGPNAVEDWEHWLRYDMTPREGALRFMMGTPNVVGMAGLIESVRFLSGLGLSNIDDWTRHLTQIAIEDLAALGYATITPTDPAQQGPIATFRVGGSDDPEQADVEATALMQKLATSGIRLTKHWDAARWPYLRISTHCYNTEEEVRRVGAVLRGSIT